jgi:hypothetical protein
MLYLYQPLMYIYYEKHLCCPFSPDQKSRLIFFSLFFFLLFYDISCLQPRWLSLLYLCVCVYCTSYATWTMTWVNKWTWTWTTFTDLYFLLDLRELLLLAHADFIRYISNHSRLQIDIAWRYYSATIELCDWSLFIIPRCLGFCNIILSLAV